MKKLLPGLTTTPGSDWREKIKEANRFGIEEIAFFPTFLAYPDRKKLYELMEKSVIKSIPHIHIRDDFSPSELDYLIDKYGVKRLNLHCDDASIKFLNENKKYQKMIFFEHLRKDDTKQLEECVKRSGGLCIDFSHLVDTRISPKPRHELLLQWMEKYPIGCCHISAIRKIFFQPRSLHAFKSVHDLDYVKEYEQFFPEYVSLELENSFEQQLKAKAHLETLLDL